jgi:hypothetical protein
MTQTQKSEVRSRLAFQPSEIRELRKVAEIKFEELNSKLPLKELKKLWGTELPVSVMIFRSGLTRTQLHRLAAKYGWKRGIYEKTGDTTDDPSIEEIQARAAAIRATWSEEETERRFKGKKRVAAKTTAISYDPYSGLFSDAGHF